MKLVTEETHDFYQIKKFKVLIAMTGEYVCNSVYSYPLIEKASHARIE